MGIRSLILASVAAGFLATPALAQVAAPAELEGPLTSIDSNTITVFKTTFKLKPATTFATPTRDNVSLSEVINYCAKQRYPGRAETSDTLNGGTAIVVGTSDDDNGTVADSVFFEPAENVLLGRVSKLPTYKTDSSVPPQIIKDPVTNLPFYDSGTLEFEGTPVVILGTSASTHYGADSSIGFNQCIPGKGVRNDFGFTLPPEALDIGTEVAAEGWYGKDGVFYAFLVDGVGAVKNQPTGVTISRAQCRDRGGAEGMEWEIRGGTANGGVGVNGAGPVTIGRMMNKVFTPYTTVVRNQTVPLTVNSVADPLNVPYGAYTFKASIVGQGVCPTEVVVQYSSLPVSATSGVDVR